MRNNCFKSVLSNLSHKIAGDFFCLTVMLNAATYDRCSSYDRIQSEILQSL